MCLWSVSHDYSFKTRIRFLANPLISVLLDVPKRNEYYYCLKSEVNGQKVTDRNRPRLEN